MAKELPYFKFEPSEWLEGNIQLCSFEAQSSFINLASGYWLKLGDVSYAFALHKYCNRNTEVLQELISNEIIAVENDKISINFLDEQLKEFNETSEKRRNAANKRWKNASAMQVHSKSNAIREEKIREEDIKEEKFSFKKSLLTLCDDVDLVNDYLIVRKNKKASNTKTAFNKLKNQIKKSNYTGKDILKICVERSWSGFESDWLKNIDFEVNDFDDSFIYFTLDDKPNNQLFRIKKGTELPNYSNVKNIKSIDPLWKTQW